MSKEIVYVAIRESGGWAAAAEGTYKRCDYDRRGSGATGDPRKRRGPYGR